MPVCRDGWTWGEREYGQPQSVLFWCVYCAAFADMLSARMMELGFALATYPSSSYMDPVELEALPDSSLQQRKQAANVRLQQTLDDYSAIIFLLHVSHDKVLNLSLLDLETLQPETPTASYWQVSEACICVVLRPARGLDCLWMVVSCYAS